MPWPRIVAVTGMAVALLAAMPGEVRLNAQEKNQVMGELQFSGATKVERESGVWVDGQYVGFVKELKGNKKILLLPGEHQVSVRRAGYKNFEDKVVIQPGTLEPLTVRMEKDPNAQYPAKNAANLKLTVVPDRAAVFVDNGYVGHASDFGGAFRSMTVAPGKHKIRVALPGYHDFETDITLAANQKSEIKAELVKSNVENTAPIN
jgi:PEGA domain